jgi:hypothetical protein
MGASSAGSIEGRASLAGVDRDAVGLLLDMAGAGGEQFAVGRAACAQRGHMTGDRSDDVVRQPYLAQHHREQRAVGPLEVTHEVGLDLVAKQTRRPAGAQRLGRMAKGRFEKIDRGTAAERLVEPLAETDAGRCCVTHRAAEQLIAAGFEKGAVADPVPRGPFENVGRVVLGDPAPQELARLVPVDQEHQRGADGGQEIVTIGGAIGLIAASDEEEAAIFAKPGRGMMVEPAPMSPEFVKQR